MCYWLLSEHLLYVPTPILRQPVLFQNENTNHFADGTLYAYTPEVLPSAHRATGNGIAVACNRIMGILSAVIATVSNTSTPVPIYICAALFIAMAAVSAAFPFEPFGRRSS